MVFWTLVFVVASIVLTELTRPKPKFEDAKPGGLGDFNFPTAQQGRPVPVLVGTNMMRGPNVIDYGSLSTEAIVKKQKTGWFSSSEQITGFRYRVYIQFGFCRGPDVSLLQVQAGEETMFSGTVIGETSFDIDLPEFLGGNEFGQGGIQSTVDFYPGSKTQTPSPFLNTTARQRITTAATPGVPRYIGTSYAIARELTFQGPTSGDIGAYIGNSTSLRNWAFELQRFPGLFPGQLAGQNIVATFDANPANWVYQILTDTEWGFHAVQAEIDLPNFLAAANTLRDEGNGMSLTFDTQRPASEAVAEFERQVDGALFVSPATGLWTIELVRGPTDPSWGYDINTVFQADDSTIAELKDFTNGAWDDTTVQVQVGYNKREDNYKEDFAPSQNAATGIMLSGGDTTAPRGSPSIIRFPGVKNRTLAGQIATREQRGLGRPLKRATFALKRQAFEVTRGKVIAWTDPRLGFDKLPMRVLRVDYGTVQQPRMEVTAIEDVFFFSVPMFAAPPVTGWTPPSTTLVAFPADQQRAFEAPRALVVRDPNFSGDAAAAKIMCAARQQGSEVAFEISQRNAVGVPGGAFAAAGDVVQFMRVGSLTSDLAAGTAIPTATITISPGPDSQTRLEQVFDDTATLQDLGQDLVQMILIDDELLLVSSAQNNAADVDLQNVYRGAAGTPQAAHSAGADVYLMFVGAGITTTTFPNTNQVDIELRMRSSSQVFAGGVTTINMTLAKRALRPYPPSASLYSGSGTPFTTPDLEADGSGLNGVGFDVAVRRRRYDTGDEVAEMLADQPVIASTEHRVRIFVDPSGANVLAYDSGWFTGTAVGARPTQAEIANEAAAGTEIRIESNSRHDVVPETDIEAFAPLNHVVTPTSVRSGQVYMNGDLAANVTSGQLTAASAGVYVINIGAGYSTSNVEFRLNGGAWTVAIAAGGTTGNIPAVAVTDVIEVRHTVNEAPARQFFEVLDPGAVARGYGVFTDGS